jgi:tetratricopeptide (TPR) repeat protein
MVEAPLPAMAPGVVSEQETIVRDSSPFYDRGVVDAASFYFGKSYPRRKIRLVLEAPSSLPLRYALVGLPDLKLQREEKDGRVRLLFESGPIEHEIAFEPLTPRNTRFLPQVIFSTGKSWADVAQHYSAIVDRQLQNADLRLFLPRGPETGAPQERASRLLERLREEIRYAAVEIGDAAIVPRVPKDVIERRYGDCKDQATLLVGLLRASGVPASVALLNSSRNADPDPDLPGLGTFDHAIVYVPGPPALWIDPTDSETAVGELPPDEQDRLVLIAAADTKGLSRTPETSSAENRQIETRDFHLAETGSSRVVETTESWGARAQSLRVWARLDVAKLKQELAEYVESEYGANEVSQVAPAAAGFAVPARLVIEIEKVPGGFTSEIDAAVYIRPSSVLSLLPAYFHTPDSADGKRSRKRDLLLPEAYTHEIRYHIIPPPGYSARELPTPETRSFGSAKLSQQYRIEADGSVTAIMRFETGERHMAPQVVDDLRTAVLELDKAEPVVVAYEQKGMSLLRAGKVREALAEFRKLAESHPNESLHRGQIARALLAAGLGEAARDEARAAVRTEPNSASAHATLAFVLQHDLLGRLRKKGFDPSGAEAEYRKALEFAPDDWQTRANLAILLEHNSSGVRYGAGARLQDAIAEYRAINGILGSSNVAENLPIALIWARRFPEAKTAAKSLPAPSPSRAALLLTATAAADGADAAIREANLLGLDSQGRQRALEAAGELLLQLRLYPRSGALLAAAAQASQNAAGLLARANLIAKLKRSDESLLPADDPRSAIQRLLMIPFSDNADLVKQVAPLISGHGQIKLLEEAENGKMAKEIRAMRARTSKLSMSPEVLLDLMLGTIRFVVDGDKSSGFRVAAQTFGGSDLVFFVVWEYDGYRILDGMEDADIASREIWERADRGDLRGARKLLDWLREGQHAAGGEDPLAGPMLPRFWTKGSHGDKDTILLAAAALLATQRDDQRALALLKSALERAGSETSRADLLLAVARGLSERQQYTEARPFAERLARMYPSSGTAFRLYSSILARQQLWRESRRAAADRLKHLPDDPDALRVLNQCAFAEGSYDEAERHLRRLVSLGKASPNDWNNLGWQALFRPIVSEQLIQEVQQGIGQNAGFDALHTVVMMYAELGKTTEARDILWQAMDICRPGCARFRRMARNRQNGGAIRCARSSGRGLSKGGEAHTRGTDAGFELPFSAKTISGDCKMNETPLTGCWFVGTVPFFERERHLASPRNLCAAYLPRSEECRRQLGCDNHVDLLTVSAARSERLPGSRFQPTASDFGAAQQRISLTRQSTVALITSLGPMIIRLAPLKLLIFGRRRNSLETRPFALVSEVLARQDETRKNIR